MRKTLLITYLLASCLLPVENWQVPCLNVTHTTLSAMPAQQGWFMAKTASGTSIRVCQRGDEHGHWLEDTRGNAYRYTPEGLQELDALELLQMQQHRHAWSLNDQQRRIEHNARLLGNGTFNRRASQMTGAEEKHGLVILVQFADYEFKFNQTELMAQYNEPGYKEWGHIGSVKDYFRDQSYGQLNLTFDVVGPYTLSQNRSYYGQNFTSGDYVNEDMHVGEMVIEACQLANADIDYTHYDWNGDGEAEQVIVLYAGGGEHQIGAQGDLVYSKEWTLTHNQYYMGDGSGAQMLDGICIDNYAVVCELNSPERNTAGLNGIGNACHEFSHCLGLPDFYDTSYRGGSGMSHWDLLDFGSYNGPTMNGEVPAPFTAYERWFCGWLEPEDLDQDSPSMSGSLTCLQDRPNAYRIPNPGNADQYYLLENRQPRGWDRYTAGLSAHGMLVTRVDYSAQAWAENTVNSVPGRQRMTYLPADGSYDGGGLNYSESAMAGDLFPGTTGTMTLGLYGHAITGIVEEEEIVHFDFTPATEAPNPNEGLDPSEIHTAEIAGTYLERSFAQMNHYACQDSIEITFSHNGDSIHIYNLQGYGTTIHGFVNWRTREITLPHQVFLSDIVMDNFDDAGNWVSADTVNLMLSADSIPTPVTGRILSDYTIQLDNWLCESYFEGEGWDWTYELYMAGTTFVRPNALMETQDILGNSHSYNVNIQYADDHKTALVTGFGGRGGIIVQVRNNGSLAIEPNQPFYFYNFYYGYASLYYPTYEGTELKSINTIRYVHGTGSADTWTLEPWAVSYDLGNYPRTEWLTTTTTLRMTDGSSFIYPEASDYGWQGSGSEQDPYMLNSASDFELLDSWVQEGTYFDGIYFRVGENIDFEGSSFTGVANNQTTTYNTNRRFEGHLDGAGHILSHLNLGSPEMSHVGLFGELRGSIQDLTIDATCSFVGFSYVGAFAGDMKTTTDARLIRCSNYASVTGYDAYIGGLAGSMAMNHLAQSCYNAGTVTSYNCKVGGLIGYMFRAKMIDCQNDGQVIIRTGLTNNPLLAQAGGLAGYACGADISNCLNTGTIQAMAKAAGLVGDIYNDFFPSHLQNCLNLGAVLCDEPSQQGAIVASCTSTSTTALEVYYDVQRQYCGAWAAEEYPGVLGLTTTQLTSGNLFENEYWSESEGNYPALLSHLNKQSADWRKCLIYFAEGETAGNLQTEAHLGEGVQGSLAEGTVFQLNEGILSLRDSQQALVTDLLTLEYGYYRTYVPLRRTGTSPLPGNGTREDPYLIQTTDDWLTFALDANINNRTFKDEYIQICNDLDFSGIDFTIPYQTNQLEFQGHLLGNNHTFSHIYKDLGAQSTLSSVSQGLLLARCGTDGSIQALRLEDCSIRGFETIGLLVGSHKGILMDCETDSLCSVRAENRYAGGLCGEILEEGFIYNCENRASVWTEQFVGGIAGYGASTQAQIIHTDNYGHIYNFEEGRNGAGHVAGLCPRFDGRAVFCSNYGLIESINGYAAGLFTKAYNGTSIESCNNAGTVLSHDLNMVSGYAAGIACEADGAIVDCGNEGQIYTKLNYAGGIVSNQQGGYLSDCWNTGEVLAGNVYAGGIASMVTVSDIVVLRCWNTGTVVAGYDQLPATESNKAGGIIGTTIEYSPILSQCWNAGEIRCDKTPQSDGTKDYDFDWDFTDAGGLVGSGSPIIGDCFNAGTVIAKKEAGGLIGRMTGGRIDHSYNVGAVSNSMYPEYAGHLVGHDYEPERLYDCFFCLETDSHTYPLDLNYPEAGLSKEQLSANEGKVMQLGEAFDYSSSNHYPQLVAFLPNSSSQPNDRSVAAHEAATIITKDNAIQTLTEDTKRSATPCYNLQGQRIKDTSAVRESQSATCILITRGEAIIYTR